MIQKRLPYCTESLYQIYSNQQIVQAILRIKYHKNLIDYRYQITFQKFFGNYAQPTGRYQKWAYDVLAFSTSIQMLTSFYKMGQLMGIYRSVILNRVKKDRIAPILTNNQRQNKIISRVQRRYRIGIVQQPQSNTMHTQSSRQKKKYKYTEIQNIKLSNIEVKRKDSCYNPSDYSGQMLRITQDLSRMIKNSCANQQKSKAFHLKIGKPQLTSYKSKDKRKLLEQNISAVKVNRKQNAIQNKILNFDDPQQNYGLKKYKKVEEKMKTKQTKNRSKIKSLKSNQSKKSLRQIKSKSKISYEKLQLTPLTPKPVSVSKNREGWDDFNKCSVFSLKSRVSSHKKIGTSLKTDKIEQKKVKSPMSKPPSQFTIFKTK